MTGRIDGEARAAVMLAQAQARSLGQRFIGCEHLLYGLAGAGDRVGSTLREHGVTPDDVGRQILVSFPGGTAAATAPGDLDAVRARLEDAFGPGSLDRPTHRSRRSWFTRRPGRRAPSGHLPVTRQARSCLECAVASAATADPAAAPDTAELVKTLLHSPASALRAVLAGLGVSLPRLAAEIEQLG
ncbi:Clp protease N-terminal domain-containing protein [Actinospica robiniae]|uniref:Clp protease N-terminal domain-containing protein n=1 Tax=Actinospica robiniae TaxID=304901 RepID=UPI000687B722|nr:Clp protease N-terminal domain-containing protein [Actinospica robiniae]